MYIFSLSLFFIRTQGDGNSFDTPMYQDAGSESAGSVNSADYMEIETNIYEDSSQFILPTDYSNKKEDDGKNNKRSCGCTRSFTRALQRSNVTFHVQIKQTKADYANQGSITLPPSADVFDINLVIVSCIKPGNSVQSFHSTAK
jgi:hypothetical protein